MRFKYKYDHLDCDLCNDMADAGCPHLLCPHIMENLKDLRHDRAFIDAIDNAGMLLTYHTQTLIYLQKAGFPHTLPKYDEPAPVPYNHGVKPECGGCPFPRVGQSCHGIDGSCVKTDFSAALSRGRGICLA